MRSLYPDHGEQLIHRDLPSFTVAPYTEGPTQIETITSPGGSTDLVPESSLAEGFVTLVSKLCVSGFRRICLCNQEILVGKRILCFLACGRFTGLVSNPWRSVTRHWISPSSEIVPPGRGSAVPVATAEYRNLAKIQKDLAKKWPRASEKIQGLRAHISVRIHKPIRRVMTSMMRRGPQ